MEKLEDKELDNSCNIIVDKAKFFSNTIENFRNFFEIDESLQRKSISEIGSQTFAFDYIDSILNDNKIKLEFEIKNDLYIEIYESEFKQALLKVLENSIDSLKKTPIENRVIYISIEDTTLSIKDSRNSVDEEILDKLFEPYFATKHKVLGVGLGLYMVQEILTKQMNFKISVKNSEFNYNKETLKGLEFSIDLKQEN